MKLSTREDIAAPIDHVFARASDFAAFERRAMREGAAVTRLSSGPVAVDTSWDIEVRIRGRKRRFTSVLTSLCAPDGYVVTTQSDGMTIVSTVDLVALSPNRTRVSVAIDMKARTLTARVVLQSLKLAKSRLSERFRARMHSYAQVIEDAYPKGS